MKINTNSNSYILLYSTGVVVVVAFLLAFVSMALKERSDANERIDRQKQILASLNIQVEADAVEAKFNEVVEQSIIVNDKGETVKPNGGFEVERKEMSAQQLPVFICKVDGQRKYVLPLVGKGLWGTIWGYLALDADCETVFGAYFSHESETAGLGALIADEAFQSEFKGQKIHDDAGNMLSVIKKGGKKSSPTTQCDGISGATLTTNGVNNMLHDYLKMYDAYLKSNKQ